MTRSRIWTLLVVAACGPANSNPTDPTVTLPPPSTAEQAPEAPPPRPADLLHCALTLQSHELGSAGDGDPSPPLRAGDGFLVAFMGTAKSDTAAGHVLHTQRVDADGTLHPARELPGTLPPGHRVIAADDGHRIYLVGADTIITRLDPSGAPELDAPALVIANGVVDLVAGPRGVTLAAGAGGRTLVRAPGSDRATEIQLPAQASFYVPFEPFLACGAEADVALNRTEIDPSQQRLDIAVVPATVTKPVVRELARGSTLESSVAAGPDGFLVVHTGASLSELVLHRLDTAGNEAEPPTTVAASDDTRVMRFPRIAALGEGWILSFWDGIGPAILRIDAQGHAIDPVPIPIRSGDERGGQTDARIAVSDTAIVLSWTVRGPWRSHGFPEEEPRRPGPRLGLLRCSDG